MFDDEQAEALLSALAHRIRLRIFRRLVRAGTAGMSSGDLSQALELAPSNLSFHLDRLQKVGLIRARRKSRNVFHAVDVEVLRTLMVYLTEECCAGEPSVCAPLLAALLPECDACEKVVEAR